MKEELAALGICSNCGATITGTYCAKCGQKRYSRHEMKFTHFVKEAVEHITHFDSKIFLAIKYLFLRPGFLTREFGNARFNAYIKPFTLFLLLNTYFFFVGHQLLSIKDADYSYYMQQYPKARNYFETYALKHNKTSIEVQHQFDHRKETFQKLSYFFIIPLFAIGLQILFIGRKKMFVEHLVHSIHTFCWYIMTLTIIIPLVVLLFEEFNWRGGGFETILLIFISLASFLYNLFSIRTIYAFEIVTAFLFAVPLTFLMIFLDTSFYTWMNFFLTWLSFKL